MTQVASFHDCDVIIVNYNAGKLLADCVSSVYAAGAARAIVVDNNSTDGSLDALLGLPCVQIIKSPASVGFAAACNSGGRVASAQPVLFLNPHCFFKPGTLVRLLDAMRVDERVDMAGGLLTNSDGTEQAGGRRAVSTPWRSFGRTFGLSRFANRWPKLFFGFYLYKQPLPDQPIEVEADMLKL